MNPLKIFENEESKIKDGRYNNFVLEKREIAGNGFLVDRFSLIQSVSRESPQRLSSTSRPNK